MEKPTMVNEKVEQDFTPPAIFKKRGEIFSGSNAHILLLMGIESAKMEHENAVKEHEAFYAKSDEHEHRFHIKKGRFINHNNHPTKTIRSLRR